MRILLSIGATGRCRIRRAGLCALLAAGLVMASCSGNHVCPGFETGQFTVLASEEGSSTTFMVRWTGLRGDSSWESIELTISDPPPGVQFARWALEGVDWVPGWPTDEPPAEFVEKGETISRVHRVDMVTDLADFVAVPLTISAGFSCTGHSGPGPDDVEAEILLLSGEVDAGLTPVFP